MRTVLGDLDVSLKGGKSRSEFSQHVRRRGPGLPARLGLPTPVDAPALWVPADNRLWPDDEEVLAPGRPELPEPDPENAIRVPQTGSGVGSERDLELVAENQGSQGRRHAVTGSRQERREARRKRLEAACGVTIRRRNHLLWRVGQGCAPPSTHRGGKVYRRQVGQAW
jgi:hypothetical protein